MKEKFNGQFAKFMEDKQQILIPNAKKYEEMVTTIQKSGRETTKQKISKQESNSIRRYSVRIENSLRILYHQGDTAKEVPQRVVKQEDLFNLLMTKHKKLGHTGMNMVWKELRDYYGILK
jgi:Txe/YoeB family toxin of Txe-Axe toxin-antitoxin module